MASKPDIKLIDWIQRKYNLPEGGTWRSLQVFGK